MIGRYELSRAGTDITFSDATAIHAEGCRVGIVTCHRCGAAILLDPREGFNALDLHVEWHESFDIHNTA